MKTRILDALAPIVEFLDTLDLSDSSLAKSAAQALNQRFPLSGEAMTTLAALYLDGVEAGWLCDREGGPGVCYSRLSKCIGESECSVDAVRMSEAGPAHTHPSGEFDLCFAVEGEPLFDGKPAGWVVYPAGSWHVPTVEGGLMNILYFLPGAAIKFGPQVPSAVSPS